MPPTDLDQLAIPGISATASLPSVAEMNAFIGPGAAPYLNQYRKLHDEYGGRPAQELTHSPRFSMAWHWPALLLTVPWLFYRKMYTGGVILVTLPVFLDHLLPGSVFFGSGLLIALTAGLLGRSWYLDRALKRFEKAERDFENQAMRSAYLQRAGGVSLSAGIFGALIQLVTATVIFLDLLPPAHF